MNEAMMSAEEAAVASEARRNKHAESVRRYQKKRSLEFKWLKSNAYALSEELSEKGLIGSLSDDSRRFLEKLEEYKPGKVPPLLKKLYGGNAKAGMSVTALDALQRLYKGKTEMASLIRRWRQQGIVVEYEIDPEGGQMDARYVLVSLPPACKQVEADPDEFLGRRFKVD